MTVFDTRQVQRAFSRASASYAAAARLQHEIESRLLESLDYLDDPALAEGPGAGAGPRLADAAAGATTSGG